jgi:MFS family permease
VRFRGPLAESYPGAVVLVLAALTPFLMLTTAVGPLQPLVQQDLGLSKLALSLTGGFAAAAYSFGTVLAVQLTSLLPVRRVLVAAATVFLIACVLAAWAPSGGVFIAGRIGQGLLTGVLLISAVPPLVIGWPEERMPVTGVIMNLGIFGAVAAGPVIGGLSASAGTWHGLFWAVAGVAAVALLFALLTFTDQEPQDPDAPVDKTALGLAAGGCAGVFFGVSELAAHGFDSAIVLAPALSGLALIAVLVAYGIRAEDPLIPLQRLIAPIPVAGILVAMAAGAGSVALVQLLQTALQAAGASPARMGNLFWPEVGAALITALLFGVLFRTRWTPLLALGGLLALITGGIVLTGAVGGATVPAAAGIGLVGLGVGACVSPALFLAGFSQQSTGLPRIFAVIELLRGVAAFMTGPVLLHLAKTASGGGAAGLRTAMWVAVAVVALGTIAVAVVYLGGGARQERPQLGRWLEREGPALEGAG